MAEEPSTTQSSNGDYHADAQVGGNVTVNVTNIYQETPGPGRSSYRGMLGFPPPTDGSSIGQRTSLVEAIFARLLQPRLNALVLTGIGGVGKSTLAALVFHYAQMNHGKSPSPFAAPPLWLSLDSRATFADLLCTLSQAVDKPIPELGILSPPNQAAALFRLLDTLGSSRLVVLNQFENLLDWTTGFALPTKAGVGEWLDVLNGQRLTGGSRLLLTSRPRPRGTRGYPSAYVQEYPVEGLTQFEGLDLLLRRGVHAPEADLRRAVIACNGHALSLTLLIALVQNYGMSLTSLLTDSSLWVGDISTNLLGAFFLQLNEMQRDLLRACSVYRTPIPLEAVTPLMGATSATEVLSALRASLARHLIQPVAEGRYQLHAMVANYARHHWVEGDERANQQALREAHARAAHYYLQQAETSYPPREKRRQLSDVQPLIEAVWQFAQAAQWREANGVVEQENLFESLSQWGENVLLLELCQLLQPGANWQPERDRAAVIYLFLADACNILGKKQEALKSLNHVLAIYREVGDRGGEGVILNDLGLLCDDLDRKQEALDYYRQALLIYREVGDRRGEGVILNDLGLLSDSLDRKQEALEYYRQALLIYREVGDRGGEGTALNNLGLLSDSLGRKQEALEYYRQALLICHEVGDRGGEGATLWNIGACYFQQQPDASLAAFLLAQQIFEEIQSPYRDEVQSWAVSLRRAVGNEHFATLLAWVKPHTQHVLEQALSRKQK